MRLGETEQQMAIRHVAEQEKRIAQQEALIERLPNPRSPQEATDLARASCPFRLKEPTVRERNRGFGYRNANPERPGGGAHRVR